MTLSSDTDLPSGSLSQLAAFLDVRREALLNNWRTACGNDPSLKGVKSLSRQEFNNQVPAMLNVLGQRLRNQTEEGQINQLAAEHGLHRWQKGYALAELLTEMQYLNRVLLEELRLFWQYDSSADATVMVKAYEYMASLANQINTGGVIQYADLQRISAASRVEALEETLTKLNELSQQRAELLRHSSHDLRSGFSAAHGAASLLELGVDSDQERQQMLDMLLRNLTNCRSLISQLMDLSRLEAGQEVLHLQPMDASELLYDLVASYQSLASERGLILKADGPANLPIVSDPVQLRRIIQNLVLNALEHTQAGWVSVSWTQENDARWIVSIQDSGPGLPPTQAGAFAQLLAPPPESTSAFNPPPSREETDPQPQTANPAPSRGGEGIGLSIVKGLCELMRADLNVESKPGDGTLFRIRLAVH